MPESPIEKARRLKAEREAAVAATLPPVIEHDADLIPEVEERTYERTEADLEIDQALDAVDILDAYARWCGKMQPKVGRKRESVMISCPKPDHRDANPSAWINLDKQTWFCGGCQEGGDKFDIAAWRFGYDVPGYKHGKAFVDLRHDMAEDLGYSVQRTPTGKIYVDVPEDKYEGPDQGPTYELNADEHESPAQSPFVNASGSEMAAVSGADAGNISLPASDDLVAEEQDVAPDSEGSPLGSLLRFPSPEDLLGPKSPPSLNWAMLIDNPDTFLWKWMDVMQHDDLPVEFYTWHGLQALGFAGGRMAYLADRTPVYGNLFTCLYGPTGMGKSRSINHLIRLLGDVFPYDYADPYSTGTFMVPMPGSSEALIDAFSRPIMDDPADPKKITGYGPARGMLHFDELATLIGRANRTGNPMKQTLMEFYDCRQKVSTVSRGAGTVIAERPFCSLVTTTQPKAINSVLMETDVDSGFVNRFVMVMGRHKTAIPYGGPTLDTTPCHDDLFKARAWAGAGRRMRLQDTSLDMWNEFYFDVIDPIKQTDDAPLLARTDLTLKKIMLLLALNEHLEVIPPRIVRAAIEIYDYLVDCYTLVSGDLGSGINAEMDKAIIQACKTFHETGGTWPSARQVLGRLGKHLRGDTALFHRQLKILTEIGIISEQVTKGARGPATVRYAYAGTD